MRFHLCLLLFSLLCLTFLIVRVEVNALLLHSGLESRHLLNACPITKDLLLVEPLDRQDLFLLLKVVSNLLEISLRIDCKDSMSVENLAKANVLQIDALQPFLTVLRMNQVLDHIMLEEISHTLALTSGVFFVRLEHELLTEAHIHVGVVVVLVILLALDLGRLECLEGFRIHLYCFNFEALVDFFERTFATLLHIDRTRAHLLDLKVLRICIDHKQ